jgi:hypothetical protein
MKLAQNLLPYERQEVFLCPKTTVQDQIGSGELLLERPFTHEEKI